MQTDPTPVTTVIQQSSGVANFLRILHLSISNVSFTSNDSGNSAALSVYAYYSLTLNSVLFDTNQAQGNTPISLQYGMCPLATGATALFSHCRFPTNTSRNGQAAIRGVAGSFRSPQCAGKLTTAAIQTVHMVSPTFTRNEIGIFMDSGAHLEVTGGTFSINLSPNYAVFATP